MKITSGTKKAVALLAKLQQDGNLVDVYSKSFFNRQPSAKEDPNATFTKEGFEWLVNEYESDSDSDYNPVGHLLLIHVDGCEEETRKELTNFYKPLGALIDAGKHDPDFLIINLFTQQILCVGLGRKNRLFVIDAATQKSVNAFGLLSGMHASGLMAGEDHGYMDNFTRHDVYECASDLIHAVHQLGVAMFRYDGIEANEEQIEYTLDSGPNESGVYKLKNWVNEIIDEDEYSRERIVELLMESKGYQAEIDDALRVINLFFPQCERGELNTGDY
jgi:hypothetical protein